jgi:alcohol dehydrogenase
MMIPNEGDLWDYAYAPCGGKKRLPNPPLPVVAVTTTAGTGSEVDAFAVVTNPDTHEKVGLGARPENFPVLAIVDAELMLTVPPKFTAFQGFDALFHATEGYVSNTVTPISGMYALESIRHIGRGLAAAVKNGHDLKAREEVARANSLSGYTMATGGLTSKHALEHSMSAYHQDLPHGAGLIMISRAYYAFMVEKHACDDRFVDMAKALGREDATRPEDFLDALVALQKDCGVADLKMSDYGIKEDELRTLAQNARSTMAKNFSVERVLLSEDDCVAIYKDSYK